MTDPEFTELSIKGRNITADPGKEGARNLIPEKRRALEALFPEIDFETFTHGIMPDGSEYLGFGKKFENNLQDEK